MSSNSDKEPLDPEQPEEPPEAEQPEEPKKGKKREPKEELSDEEFKRLWEELEALDILFPPPSQPMPVARKLMKGRTFRGLPTLLHWRNGWMRWEEAHWIEIEERTIRAECYQRLEEAEPTQDLRRAGRATWHHAPARVVPPLVLAARHRWH
jgi:hypothetical protein